MKIGTIDGQPLTIRDLRYDVLHLSERIQNLSKSQEYILNKMIYFETIFDLEFINPDFRFMIEKCLGDNIPSQVVKYKIQLIREDKELISKIEQQPNQLVDQQINSHLKEMIGIKLNRKIKDKNKRSIREHLIFNYVSKLEIECIRDQSIEVRLKTNKNRADLINKVFQELNIESVINEIQISTCKRKLRTWYNTDH